MNSYNSKKNRLNSFLRNIQDKSIEKTKKLLREATFVTLVAAVALNAQMSYSQSGCDGSGNCYVRQDATGNGTGSDHANAYTGFGTGATQVNPSNMQRGVKYYVDGGSYNTNTTTNFNTPDSGTAAITVQASTIEDHGTNTGWNNAYQAQALFGPWQVQSDYWNFSGVYRGKGTGNPWIDWRSSYGFKVNNNNGSNAPINSSGAILVGCGCLGANGQAQNYVSVKYIEVQGSGDVTGAYTDLGIQFTGGASQNNYAGYNYVHDVGIADGIDGDSVSNFTIEENWVQNNAVTAAWHSEILAIRCWNNGPDNDIIIRWNFVENSNSTAMIATPCVNYIIPSNWGIYGNVFFYNKSEVQPGYSCNDNPTECGNGDGWLSLWNFQTWSGYLYVANNTISFIDTPGGECHHDWGGQTGMTMGDVRFLNNAYYGCKENISTTTCPGTCTNYVDDYNSYFDMDETNDTGQHVQVEQIDPFVNVGQTQNADNFALTTDTAAWFNTNSILSGNNVDLFGNTRTSSRGAFQYTTTSVPNPPTGLSATVN